MGEKLKRIYQNCENGGYCIEEVAKSFFDMYPFSQTEYVYDIDTKYVYYMPTASSTPVLHKSPNGKYYKFTSIVMVEVDD